MNVHNHHHNVVVVSNYATVCEPQPSSNAVELSITIMLSNAVELSITIMLAKNTATCSFGEYFVGKKYRALAVI